MHNPTRSLRYDPPALIDLGGYAALTRGGPGDTYIDIFDFYLLPG